MTSSPKKRISAICFKPRSTQDTQVTKLRKRASQKSCAAISEGAAIYPVHDVGPAFHRHTLEHGQHRKAEVVEVGDAVIRTDPAFLADQIGAVFVVLAAHSTATRKNRINSDLVCAKR